MLFLGISDTIFDGLTELVHFDNYMGIFLETSRLVMFITNYNASEFLLTHHSRISFIEWPYI